MIKYLFLKNIKDNKYLVISFIAILLLYSTIAIGMYDPQDMGAMQQMFELLPKAMVDMMGFNLAGPLVNYISNYLFGFITIVFPMIFLIMMANKLVAKMVTSGSMTYLVTTPYTRKRIIITQIVFYSSSLFLIFVIPYLVVIVMSATMFPGLLDYGTYAIVNLVTFSIMLLYGSIAFLFSTWMNDSSKMLATASAFGIISFVLNMIYKLGDKIDFLKYFSIFATLDVNRIIDHTGYAMIIFGASFLLSITIFYISVIVFDKKSLIL